MKVAYVTPRYGTEVVGGAEHAARMLAERLVSQLSWDVEVYSSCALDTTTWANHYPAGKTSINGVEVHRFPVSSNRHPDFIKLSGKVHRNPKLSLRKDQDRWIDYQGPLTPELVEALEATDADVVVFYPYLYYPTVRGLPKVKHKSVMHPAAHDEASIRLPVYSSVFAQTQGFVFQTDSERQLAESLFPIADRPQLLLGLGVEPQVGDVEAFRRKFNLGDSPYLLCAGRVDEGKGSVLLAKYFTEFKTRNPGSLKLVYIGPVVKELKHHADIVVAGVVSEEEKWAALEGAEILISPSPFEAFSLVLIEAWACRKPVIVNASCNATREHVERSGGGLWFDGYLSFESAVEMLLTNSEIAQSMATAGQSYVDARFRWSALIERYGKFLESIAERAA